MSGKHGVFVYEEGTALTVPRKTSAGVQVVIGTAPVNILENPASAVNVPILANSAPEAMAALGYSDDFSKYTLCQTMYVTSNLFQVSPVVYINVLDPAVHKTALEETTVNVSSLQATVKTEGILKAGLTVKSGSTELVNGTDYSLAFDSDGYLVITLMASGAGATAAQLTVSGFKLDASAVDKSKIIGSYNASTGAETGAEVIRQVYPKLGIVPGLILAPGWSHEPEVGIALAAKAANINGVFKAMAVVDLNPSTVTKYTDCLTAKEDSGYTSEFVIPCWPSFKVGEKILSASAVIAARAAYTDSEHEDIPSNPISNKSLPVTGTCLADGTEVTLDQDQATVVGEYGVMTAFCMNGFKTWGNHTGAYPGSGDAKDIWINVRRMFDWQGNTFIQTYFSKVDDPMNYKLIENVVDSENIRCAAYAPEHWAGASIEYLESDNPVTDILAGQMTFRQHIAPYTPAETIHNILNYDTEMLAAALTGGE